MQGENPLKSADSRFPGDISTNSLSGNNPADPRGTKSLSSSAIIPEPNSPGCSSSPGIFLDEMRHRLGKCKHKDSSLDPRTRVKPAVTCTPATPVLGDRHRQIPGIPLIYHGETPELHADIWYLLPRTGIRRQIRPLSNVLAILGS